MDSILFYIVYQILSVNFKKDTAENAILTVSHKRSIRYLVSNGLGNE
ncbi:hypothetical protein [Phocaeicola sp.]